MSGESSAEPGDSPTGVYRDRATGGSGHPDTGGTGDYGQRYAATYRLGRALPDETMAAWGAAVERRAPANTRIVMDLGAGTGRFSRTLAARLACPVIAVEPSAAMRNEAEPAAGVHGARARAEALPVAGGSLDLVWASQVMHLVDEVPVVAGEIARVLRVGGRLLVRGVFGDSCETVSWLPWFPQLRARIRQYFDLTELTAALAGHGLDLVAHDRIRQTVASDLGELHERTRARADSVLGSLNDEEFARGLERLRRDAQRLPASGPVSELVDLVVYERR